MNNTAKGWIPIAMMLIFVAHGAACSHLLKDPVSDTQPDPCTDAVRDCCLPEKIAGISSDALLKAAAKCRGSDRFNICDLEINSAYHSYLEMWATILEAHETTTPIEKLAVRKEILSLRGRMETVQSVTPDQCMPLSCEECENSTCREQCLGIRKEMVYWRNRYKNTMKGNEYLHCQECLEALEAYYNDQLQLYYENRLDEKKIFSSDHLDLMWGLLFCLSPSANEGVGANRTCLEEAREIVPHAMLPFTLPPSELIQLLKDQLDREEVSLETIDDILTKKQQSVYVIKKLAELFKENGRASGIPPKELAEILMILIYHQPTSLHGMEDAERLKILNEMFRSASKEMLAEYTHKSETFKQNLAEFVVLALRKADSATLELLTTLGFTNEDLLKLIKIQFEKDGDEGKVAFINQMLKNFDPEILGASNIFVEQFFKLGDETQKRIIEENRYKKEILRLVENLNRYRPEYLREIHGSDDKALPPDIRHKYLLSFMMPGYSRSYYEPAPSSGLKFWNYSNYLLLGLSLSSELLFIDSEYEKDIFYQIGVAGAYLFVANGIAGVADAAIYIPPRGETPSGYSYPEKSVAMMFQIHF